MRANALQPGDEIQFISPVHDETWRTVKQIEPDLFDEIGIIFFEDGYEVTLNLQKHLIGWLVRRDGTLLW